MKMGHCIVKLLNNIEGSNTVFVKNLGLRDELQVCSNRCVSPSEHYKLVKLFITLEPHGIF